MTTYFAKDFEKRGGKIFLNYEVRAFKEVSEDSDAGRYPLAVCSKDKVSKNFFLSTFYNQKCISLMDIWFSFSECSG